MAAEKALALVVRGTDWSETSRIVTLWTREFGKIRALAKGGRRLKSSFEIALDLLTVCNIVVIRKHSGGLDLLTEAQVVERFPHLRTKLAALYAGYYVAELLADGTQDYDPHPELFDISLSTLRNLEGDANRLGAISAFELAWLRELGYSPRLDACVVCGREVSFSDAAPVRIGYSPIAGGILCATCIPSARDARSLTGFGLLALRQLNEGEANLADSTRREVRQILGQTVSSVLGRRPKLLGYIDGG